MSIVQHSHTERQQYSCSLSDCVQTFTPQDAYHGSFCSRECSHRKLGRKQIRQLKNDHRYCSTSFVKIRDVYPPGRRAYSKHVYANTDDPSDDPCAEMNSIDENVVIGRAIGTPDADYGERNYRKADRVGIGIISPAGPGIHSTTDRPNTVDRALEFASNLSESIRELMHEGKHSYHHNHEILIQEILRTRLRRGPETMIRQEDYERALGRAIAECPR